MPVKRRDLVKHLEENGFYLLREGGKIGPFTPKEFPPPYVPRYLTFEISESLSIVQSSSAV